MSTVTFGSLTPRKLLRHASLTLPEGTGMLQLAGPPGTACRPGSGACAHSRTVTSAAETPYAEYRPCWPGLWEGTD